jgi:hypothetical protein
MKRFKKYLQDTYKKRDRFSIPVIELGIMKRSGGSGAVNESIFISHSKAKGKGLLWKGLTDKDSTDNISDHDKLRLGRYNMRVHSDKTEEEGHYNLDDSEKNALQGYTMDSSDINRELHRVHKSGGEMGGGRITALDSGISKGKVGEHNILYTGLGSKIHRNLTGMLKRGIVHNPGYTSTSHHIGIATGFCGRGSDGNKHILEIHLPENHEGMYLEPITDMGGEYETVLPRGMTFRVGKRPRLHIRNGEVHHVWRAEPISKEDGEQHHNKVMDRMLREGDVRGLKDYYKHEAGESDKDLLHAMVTTDPDKQEEYYRDERNHGLLAGNESLVPSIRDRLMGSNKEGIQKHFASINKDPGKHEEYFRRGYYEELGKNPHVSPHINERLVGVGNSEVMESLINKIEARKADHGLLSGIIKKADSTLLNKIAKTKFYDDEYKEKTEHFDDIIDKDNFDTNNHLLDKDLSHEHLKKIWDKNLGDNRQNMIYKDKPQEFINKLAVSGSDSDKEHISGSIGLIFSNISPTAINALSHSKNDTVIKNLIDNKMYLPEYAKKKLGPAITPDRYEIERYLEDPNFHYLLKHNPNLEDIHHKKIMLGDSSHANNIIGSGKLTTGLATHILDNHIHAVDEKNRHKVYERILGAGPYGKKEHLEHISNNGDEMQRSKARQYLEQKNEIEDVKI